jgi:hypothetical protein
MRIISSLELEAVSGGMDTVVITGSYSNSQMPSGAGGSSTGGPQGLGNTKADVGESYRNGSWFTPPNGVQVATEAASCAAGVAGMKANMNNVNIAAGVTACATVASTVNNAINWSNIANDLRPSFIGPNGVPYKPVP